MRGFSVVELVVVVLLLGILSATAMSRFVRPSAFAPETVSHAALSQGRFASQSGHARRNDAITFSLARAADDWQVAVLANGLPLRSTEIAAHNSRVFVSNSGPPVELDPATSLMLAFDASGALSGGSVGANPIDPTLGVEVDVQGDSSRQLCFYPTGYASDAACR